MEKNKKTINKVLRYLGYKGQKIDTLTQKTIEETIVELESLVDRRYIYKIFKKSSYKENLLLDKTRLLLSGKDIDEHLAASNTCILMAATLGHSVDTRIRYYEKLDMTKALILDAGASVFIEEFCDRICMEIEKELDKNKVLTSRFSPGYGDLPIDIQAGFLKTLDAYRSIGLTTNSNSILIPRKSVTAILGVIDKDEDKIEARCIHCHKYRECDFSRQGDSYEY